MLIPHMVYSCGIFYYGSYISNFYIYNYYILYIIIYYICLTSLTHAKCSTHSTLCLKVGNISGSIELFAL